MKFYVQRTLSKHIILDKSLSETWAALTSRDSTDRGWATAELWPADYD